MGPRRTKMDENNATIFILIRVSSYPCFLHPWLFSQERLGSNDSANSSAAAL